MKRISLIAMMVLLAVAGAWAQDLTAFQSGFTTFAGELAPTLSYNATVGNNWSDAYIGGFPHLGVGVAAGATTVPVASMTALFESMGITLPAALETYGLPIPAAALSVKLGGFILPFDVGLKGMILPEGLRTTLADAGIDAEYTLFGGNIRYALLKQNILFPDISIGAGYNRLSGAIVTPLGVTGQSFEFTTPDLVNHTLAVSDPDLALRWTTDSYDFTLQVSKNLLFIRPYIGVGYSVGKSSVKGGIESALTYDTVAVTATQVEEIKDNLTLAGISVPDLSAEGFMFGKDSTEPALRVYGGVSLALIIIHLDVSATYVPATKSMGASAMIRVQL